VDCTGGLPCGLGWLLLLVPLPLLLPLTRRLDMSCASLERSWCLVVVRMLSWITG
jgi:hypothetical protein